MPCEVPFRKSYVTVVLDSQTSEQLKEVARCAAGMLNLPTLSMDNPHITLGSFGEIHPDEVPNLIDRIRDCSGSFGNRQLEVGGLSLVGNRNGRSAAVLGVRVNPRKEVISMHRVLDNEVARPTGRQLSRIEPHVSMAFVPVEVMRRFDRYESRLGNLLCELSLPVTVTELQLWLNGNGTRQEHPIPLQ